MNMKDAPYSPIPEEGEEYEDQTDLPFLLMPWAQITYRGSNYTFESLLHLHSEPLQRLIVIRDRLYVTVVVLVLSIVAVLFAFQRRQNYVMLNYPERCQEICCDGNNQSYTDCGANDAILLCLQKYVYYGFPFFLIVFLVWIKCTDLDLRDILKTLDSEGELDHKTALTPQAAVSSAPMYTISNSRYNNKEPSNNVAQIL